MNLEKRLDRIATRKNAADEAKRIEQEKRKQAEREKEATRIALAKIWTTDKVPMIHSVIDQVNSRVQDAGIKLIFKSELLPTHGLAQAKITAVVDGASAKRELTLHATYLGIVQISSPDGSVPPIPFDELNESEVGNLLATYLESMLGD